MMVRMRGRQQGSVLAEFAIVVPIILLMIVGAIDFGRVWTIASASANAAQAGAQYGSQSVTLSADLDGMLEAATNDLSNSAMIRGGVGDEDGTTLSDFTVTPERFCECSGAAIACTSNCAGGVKPSVFVRVTVESTFNTIFDYPGIPTGIPVERVAVMRAR